MSYFSVSAEQITQFRQDGFLLVENMFDAEEIGLLSRIARADREKAAQVRTTKDTQGGESYRPLAQWDDSRVKEIGGKQWEALQNAGG